MSERCPACGRPLVWADGRLTCPVRTCSGHGEGQRNGCGTPDPPGTAPSNGSAP